MANFGCWGVSSTVCTRNDIFSTSDDYTLSLTHTVLLAKTGLAHSPQFSFSLVLSPSQFFSPPIMLYLLSAQFKLHSLSISASTVKAHTLSHTPPTLSPGCRSNSVGSEHHPCLTPLRNHTPILFLLLLQSHAATQLVQYRHPYTCRSPGALSQWEQSVCTSQQGA